MVTPNSQSLLTDLSYTGQRDLGMGLMDYHARFYSPVLGRFTQPDTVIPNEDNPQAWNRYSYVMNSPVLYNDPSGHMQVDVDGGYQNEDKDMDRRVKERKDKEKREKNEELNLWPDYWVLSISRPLWFMAGVTGNITLDKYANIYFSGGPSMVPTVPSASFGAGYFLAPGNDTEAFAEKFLQGHAFDGSATYGLGLGVNNNYPSYSDLNHTGAKIENISVEVLAGSPGGSVAATYGVLLYDLKDIIRNRIPSPLDIE